MKIEIEISKDEVKALVLAELRRVQPEAHTWEFARWTQFFDVSATATIGAVEPEPDPDPKPEPVASPVDTGEAF